ncbi:hypothetical protein Tco_0725162 [Tanacetum coccineum]|uniref:Uncharacterized protein n=1 Tax=Tanacetum coccineum TaxID=301880 RepID=A0ABQ4YCZ8_9ASTR
MSTSNTHQQSLADVGSKIRSSMLERGSYIPWASHFRRYINRKRENKKWLNKAIDEGTYEFRTFTPSETEEPRMQTEEDLRGDDLKHYEDEIEAMNLILISIPNDIYNFVDACTIAQAMWQRVERLINGIKFPKVTVNTKFLNCLQPEWLKYVTQVRLAKRLTEDTYDDLTTSPYYVTHHSSVIDYDDDYRGDVVQNNSEDPLTSAMILLDRAITQRFSNPTNNRLRTSSNTKNQAIVQGDRVNIQSRNSGNDGRNTRRSYVQEEMIEAKQDEAGVILTDEQNNFLFADASRMEEIEELSANICLMARIQPTNFDFDPGPSYDYAFLSEVQILSTNYVNPLFAKNKREQKYQKQPKIINNTIGDDQIDSNIIFDEPNEDANSGSVEYDNNIQESYKLEQLAKNAFKEAEKQ